MEILRLRPLEINDFSHVLSWSRDPLFCEANGWAIHQDVTRLYEWWTRCVNQDIPHFQRIGIEWGQRLIGYVDLADIQNGTAEVGIAIGDSSLWQRGLGAAALEKALHYGQHNHDIKIFTAETSISNKRAVKMLMRAGFRKTNETDSSIYFMYTT